MKNIIIVILALLVAAAIISGFIFHGKYLDMKDAVGVSNEKLSGLNEKVAQLQNENAELNSQITENAKRLRELESPGPRISQLEDAIAAKDKAISELDGKVAQLREENARLSKQIRESAERISQLEGEIKVKDQAFSRLDENVRKLEEGSKEERKIAESLRTELSSKDAMVAELREKLRGEKSMAKARIEDLRSTYESLISELKSNLKDKEMTIRKFEEKLSITFVDRVLFDFGSATITPKGETILTRVADSLKNIHGMKVRVVGHTDDRPIKEEYLWKFPSNWELSSARAAAVVRFLQGKSGLDPESFEVVGRAFYEPVATNESEEGRAQNRRVEVIIAPKVEEQWK
jgi:chemotaxis protein MotB